MERSSFDYCEWYIDKIRILHREYGMGAKYVCRHLASCYGLTLEESLVEKILAHSAKENSSSRGQDWKRLRSIWRNMHRRCVEESHPRYHRYGGRRISVCKSWTEFWSFHKWSMVSGYKDGLTLDRIDVDGDYEPANCKWSTLHEQSANKSANKQGVCTPGVHKLPDGTYKSSLTIDKKVVYFEHFPTEKEAIAARREAERTYLGYSITSK